MKMNKIANLADLLISYPDESKQLRSAISSYYFPMLLKIAQEQEPLIPGAENKWRENSSGVNEDYSFLSEVGQFGFEKDDAEFLDTLVDKILAKNPDLNRGNVIKDIREEFEVGKNRNTRYYDNRFSERQEKAFNKYLAMFPELRWNPGSEQLQLPFEEVPKQLQLGGITSDFDKAETDRAAVVKIMNDLLDTEKYAPLGSKYREGNLESLYYGGTYALNSQFTTELTKLVEEAGIKWNGSFSDLLAGAAKNIPDVTRLDKIEGFKKDLEERWHKLQIRHKKLQADIAGMQPESFIVKPATEIKTLKDSIAAVVGYMSFVIKKFAVERISFQPYKSAGYSSHSFNSNSRISNIEDLRQLLEIGVNDKGNKTNLDPTADYHSKSGSLTAEENYCASTEYSMDQWQKFIKSFDKKIIAESDKYAKDISPESLKTVTWIEKYRPDILREVYNKTIQKIASNIADEAEKHSRPTVSKDFTDHGEENRFSLDSRMFGYKLTQTKVIESLAADINYQIKMMTEVVMDEIVKKLIGHLWRKATAEFDSKYFKYQSRVNEDDEEIFVPAYERVVTHDGVLRFIQEWNGQPNLKSYISVIQNVTKDPAVVDNFLKMQLGGESRVLDIGRVSFLPSECIADVSNFVLKTRSSSVEEMMKLSESALLPAIHQKMMTTVAKSLFSFLSTTGGNNRFSGAYSGSDPTVNITSDGWTPLAPTLNSSAVQPWLKQESMSGNIIERATPRAMLNRVSLKMRNAMQNKANRMPDLFGPNENGLKTNDPDPEKTKRYFDCLKEMDVVHADSTNESKTTGLKQAAEKAKEFFTENERDIFFGKLIPGTTQQLRAPPLVGGKVRIIKTKRNVEQIRGGYYRYSDMYGFIGDKEFIVQKITNSFCTVEGEAEKIDMPIEMVTSSSPSLEDYYNAIKELRIEKYTGKSDNSIKQDDMLALVDKLGMPKQELQRKFYEDVIDLARSIDSAKMESNEFPGIITAVVDDIARIDKFGDFIISSKITAEAFGGIGFRDITAGIDRIFAESKVVGLSKKEFVQKIMLLTTHGLTRASMDIADKMLITAFLRSVPEGVFKDIVAPVINLLNIRDTESILRLCENMLSRKRNMNFTRADLEVSLKSIPVTGLNITNVADRICAAASFIHNHSKIPVVYIRNLVNSPNFTSDTKISKEFIETCTKLYEAGGLKALKDPASVKGKIVASLASTSLIPDLDAFFSKLTSFSRLCANKDGVRPNLGNPTMAMKLQDNVDKTYDEGENPIVDFDKLNIEDKISALRIEYSKRFPESQDPTGYYRTEELNKFDNIIKKMRESASTPEQYAKDIKVKAIIQSAASLLNMIEQAAVMMKYAKDAKKKDSRLFNFQYEDPAGKFRFRVLKDLDPYHFSVGADTGCCQRIGGAGENAAIDSFINPLAGVLLLEVNNEGTFNLVAQSYFHYVAKDNGVILDNVETNSENMAVFRKVVNQSIDETYAAFATFIQTENKLDYVRCGKGYNKLTNGQFITARFKTDPRSFAGAKYTDFKTGDHIDLLRPKFKPSMKFKATGTTPAAKLARLLGSFGFEKEASEIFDMENAA